MSRTPLSRARTKPTQATRRKKKASKSPPKKKQPKWFKCATCRSFVALSKRRSHACIPPTEAQVFSESDPVRLEVWEELRDFADGLGEQRIYASPKAVMFARRVCYLFVRPKRNRLEVSFFLSRPLEHPLIHHRTEVSKRRTCYVVHVSHRDLLEPPLTEWLREAYQTCSE